MTPKLKALLLIESMSFSRSKQMNYANGEMVDIPQNLYAKQCALVAVDEIIKSNPTSQLSDPFIGNKTYENVNYWKEVKNEIEKL
jgi:hypothetical protein